MASGMTEFWIILVVAVLIFATSRIGDLGKIMSDRFKSPKDAAKESKIGQRKL